MYMRHVVGRSKVRGVHLAGVDDVEVDRRVVEPCSNNSPVDLGASTRDERL
jgi:hypothetical protein